MKKEVHEFTAAKMNSVFLSRIWFRFVFIKFSHPLESFQSPPRKLSGGPGQPNLSCAFPYKCALDSCQRFLADRSCSGSFCDRRCRMTTSHRKASEVVRSVMVSIHALAILLTRSLYCCCWAPTDLEHPTCNWLRFVICSIFKMVET